MSVGRSVGSVVVAASPAFIAFRWRSGPRTITPYDYAADGLPSILGPVATLASSPSISGVDIKWAKRTGGNTYVIVRVRRTGATSNTMLVYDVTAKSWTAEVNSRAAGEDDFNSTFHSFMTLTADAFIYQFGETDPGANFVLRKLSTDLVSTDTKLGSEIGLSGGKIVQVDADTVGQFNTSAGLEIDTDGTVTNPTAYDILGSGENTDTHFPATNFLGETLSFRDLGPFQIQISGADITWTARFSGWSPTVLNNVHLNDAETAFGVYALSQTSSPPSNKFDWIDALPKTAEHASSVDIRPTDYVSAGSPGTVAELPDAVFALTAGP